MSFVSRRAAKQSQKTIYQAQIQQLRSQIEGQQQQLVLIQDTILSPPG